MTEKITVEYYVCGVCGLRFQHDKALCKICKSAICPSCSLHPKSNIRCPLCNRDTGWMNEND